MSASLDPRTAALERRLGRLSGVEPASGLRHRVLMAVDDELAERRPPCRAAADDAPVPGWAFAVAATLGIGLALPFAIGVAGLRRHEPVTLVARLRAAGVDDEPLLAALATAAPGPAASATDRRRDTVPPRAALRAIDAKRLSEENL